MFLPSLIQWALLRKIWNNRNCQRNRGKSQLLIASIIAAGLPSVALADLVLTPTNDGSLVAFKSSTLIVFENRTEPRGAIWGEASSTNTSGKQSKAVGSRNVPPSAVLEAINATGMKYARSPALRKSDLRVTDWLALFRANIEIESAYKIKARSHVGAIGLGQLMPDTAKALGVDPYDWRQNLDGSARYLLAMLNKFGSKELALAAYNAGPHAVEKYNGIPPYRETQNHVVKVVRVYNRLKGEI